MRTYYLYIDISRYVIYEHRLVHIIIYRYKPRLSISREPMSITCTWASKNGPWNHTKTYKTPLLKWWIWRISVVQQKDPFRASRHQFCKLVISHLSSNFWKSFGYKTNWSPPADPATITGTSVRRKLSLSAYGIWSDDIPTCQVVLDDILAN